MLIRLKKEDFIMKKNAFRYLAIILIIAVVYFKFISPMITGETSGNSGSSSTGDQTETTVSVEEENSQLKARVAELEAQLQTLENGGNVPDESFKEFLDSCFIPDGKKHRLTADVELHATPECDGDIISSEGLVFLQDEAVQLPERDGIAPKMVYDENGNVYYTLSNVYYEDIPQS